jgi:hypothetical protein
MSHRSLSACALGLASVLFAGPSFADSLRCGDNLVSTGDSLYEVRASCGEPDDALHRVEVRTLRYFAPAPCHWENGHRCCTVEIVRTIEVVIDDLTYDFGHDHFIEYLHFEDGRLLTVNEGSYGHKDAH